MQTQLKMRLHRRRDVLLQRVHPERFICVQVSAKRFILLNRKGKAAGAGAGVGYGFILKCFGNNGSASRKWMKD